jgi:hypothetical protein
VSAVDRYCYVLCGLGRKIAKSRRFELREDRRLGRLFTPRATRRGFVQIGTVVKWHAVERYLAWRAA